jgi:beta-lactamase regulating signal transducer with metallopeptidase domain/thiol-disulfide isomerase/thioredoxin
MNPFTALTTRPLAGAEIAIPVTLTLLHFLWQGALLGLAAMVADRWLRRRSSRARYTVFVGILLTMGVAPLATYWVIGGRAGDTSMSTPASPTAPFVMTNNAPTTFPQFDGAPTTSAPSSGGDFTPMTGSEPAVLFTSPPSPASEPRTRGIEAYASFVAVAYLAGAMLMLVRLMIALQGGRRLRLSATVIRDGPVAELVWRQAQRIGLKTAPIVAWCGRISVPVVVGIVRPMILLPAALASGFDPNQLEALVTHELAHIRRFDPLVNIVQRLIEVALFFHPAVWYVSRRVSGERENACDDLVLLAGWPAVNYANALLQMAELCAATRGIRTEQGALLAASGSGSSQFKRRVLRLLEVQDAPRVRLSRGGTVLVATAAVLTFMTPTLIRAVTDQDQALGTAQQEHDPSLAGDKSATLARVFAAWKKRQEHVKSFHFSWTTRVTAPPGYVPFNDEPLLAGLRARDFEDAAENEVHFTIPQSEWWGEGASRFRSDFRTVGKDGANGWKQLEGMRIIRDGNLFSRLLVPVSTREASLISIWREFAIKNPGEAFIAGDFRLKSREVDLAPLRLALRPMVQVSSESAPFCYNSHAWSPDNCRVVSENSIVDNVHCIKLQQDMNNHFETCWVDPKRDYIVVFWERRILDRPARSAAIEYQQDRDHGWLPSRWTSQVAGRDGQRSATLQATVTRYTINENFPGNPFANSYPPGTQVFDVTTDRPGSGDTEPGGPQQQNDRATLDAIAAAWARRQAKFSSFKFSWKRRSPELITSTHTLSVDGERFATAFLNTDRKPFRFPTGTKTGEFGYPADLRLVFDGSTTTDLLISDSRKLVTIASGLREHDVEGLGNRTLLDALRLLDSHFFGIDLSKFRVAQGGGKIGDAQCVLIEIETKPGHRDFYWLDPARDYLLLREHSTVNGQDSMRIDFSYRSDPRFGWVPTGWKFAFAGHNGVTDTVTDYTINQPLAASEFQIEIPKGAEVRDMRKGGDSQKRADASRAEGTREIYLINREWQKAILQATRVRRDAKSPTERKADQKDSPTSVQRLVARCLELANRQPESAPGLIALKLVACRAAETEEGKQAAAALIKKSASVDLTVLAEALHFPTNVAEEPVRAVMPIVFARVKRNPGHPDAAKLLASVVCAMAIDDFDGNKAPPEFTEAAELIVNRYADSADVRNFCEELGSFAPSPAWAAPFERHLRIILEKNQHREVRAAASYALASVVALAGKSRQSEAERLYAEAIQKYDGSEKYFFDHIEKMWSKRASAILFELGLVGKPAPAIEGMALDGRPLKLSEYRGKVVLLTFWATWCGPCMQMVPHERTIAQRLNGKPFAIVGVNGDDEDQEAKAAVAQNGITWRSFASGKGHGSIAQAWHVWSWPTIYLIDQKGIIRKQWTDARPAEFNRAIDQLLAVETESKAAK